MPLPIPHAYAVEISVTPPSNGHETKPTVYVSLAFSREMVTEDHNAALHCERLVLDAWRKLVQNGALPELCK